MGASEEIERELKGYVAVCIYDEVHKGDNRECVVMCVEWCRYFMIGLKNSIFEISEGIEGELKDILAFVSMIRFREGKGSGYLIMWCVG